MAITGEGWLCTSSTNATDFSLPTSNGATAPGNSTALRIGNTASSSPNRISSSVGGGAGVGGIFLLLISDPREAAVTDARQLSRVRRSEANHGERPALSFRPEIPLLGGPSTCRRAGAWVTPRVVRRKARFGQVARARRRC